MKESIKSFLDVIDTNGLGQGGARLPLVGGSTVIVPLSFNRIVGVSLILTEKHMEK